MIKSKDNDTLTTIKQYKNKEQVFGAHYIKDVLAVVNYVITDNKN